MSFDQTEDTQRFMEVAGSDVQKEKRHANAFLDDDEEGEQKGADVQYANNGPGFVPVSSTVANLPAGVYSIDGINNQWTFVPHKLVTDALLRLPDSKSDFVIQEIERFWGLKDRFKSFGYTHKRGFLLWGPPGSGKTATVSIVARQMVERNGIVVLCDTNPGVLSNMMTRFRAVEPQRPALVILEDVDAYIRDYGETNVLSILDGENSIDNVVYIATTNYPERLDPRVVNRPSRFDLIMLIDMPNADARRIYLKSRNTGLTDDEIEDWVKQTDGFSIAHIKEMIVGVCLFGKSFSSEIARLRSMMKKGPNSEERGKTTLGFGN